MITVISSSTDSTMVYLTNPPPSLEVLILMSWRWNSWSTNETQLAEYGSPLWTTSISSQHRGSITVTSWSWTREVTAKWSRMRGTQHLLHPLKLAWDAWDSKKVRGQGLAHGKCEAFRRTISSTTYIYIYINVIEGENPIQTFKKTNKKVAEDECRGLTGKPFLRYRGNS